MRTDVGMNLLAPFAFERQMFHGLWDAQNPFPWVGEGGFNPPSPLAHLPLCCSFSMGQLAPIPAATTGERTWAAGAPSAGCRSEREALHTFVI